MPRISVVIPTYNQADTISRAIDSALAQTVSDLEVLVVDDASTDTTEQVVTAYEDRRVTLLTHENNRGGAAARNTGIEAAVGDYIAFLDSDDEWCEKKIERQFDELSDRPDDYVASYCDIVEQRTGWQKLLYELTKRLIPGFKKSSTNEGGSELIREIHADRFHLGGASTLLVERETVEAINGFNERFPRHQDLEFLVRILRRGKIAYVPDELVVRHHSGLPDIEAVEAAKKQYFETFQTEIAQLEADGVPVTAHHRFALARLYYQQGQIRQGTKYLIRSSPSENYEYLRLLWSAALGIRDRIV